MGIKSKVGSYILKYKSGNASEAIRWFLKNVIKDYGKIENFIFFNSSKFLIIDGYLGIKNDEKVNFHIEIEKFQLITDDGYFIRFKSLKAEPNWVSQIFKNNISDKSIQLPEKYDDIFEQLFDIFEELKNDDVISGIKPDDYDEYFKEKAFFKKISTIFRRVKEVILIQLLSMYYCAIDPKTDKSVRLKIFGALAYFVLPFDLYPDMLPGGYLDDVYVLKEVYENINKHITDVHTEKAKSKIIRLTK